MRLTEYAGRVDHERNPLMWIAKLLRKALKIGKGK